MQSKSTRIAYLKRMLKRLEGEDLRIQLLASKDELSGEAKNLLVNQLNESRKALLSELHALQNKDDPDQTA